MTIHLWLRNGIHVGTCTHSLTCCVGHRASRTHKCLMSS
jgi:hypothetical protein